MRADLDAEQVQSPCVSAAIPGAAMANAAPTGVTTFVSFDRRVRATTYHQRPDRYRHLEAPLGSVPRIARGGGYGYAAASFGPGIVVQEMTAFSRILAFDEATRQVVVEAGIRIGDLLQWASSRGLCLDVVPGYPGVTVGGCIAGDVHGKNAGRAGTFRECTQSIRLYRPDVSFITVSRLEGGDVFEATCGGFGLTGLIVSAVLQLVPLPARQLTTTRVAVESLEQAAHVLLESRASFAYSWHPGVAAKTVEGGAGLVFESEWDASVPAAPPARKPRRSYDRRPFGSSPVGLWNAFTLPLASKVFGFIEGQRQGTVSIFDNWFPARGHEMYYRFFGASGFGEMQLLVPAESIARFISAFRRVVAAKRPTIAFLSLKAFRGEARSLGLSGAGLLFAVDYVASADCAGFESDMDALLLDTGSQPNISKDSRIDRLVAERSLPGLDRFREVLLAIDPQRRYQSALSRRLAL